MNNFVDKTSSESISGVKTFTGNGWRIQIQSNVISTTQAPSQWLNNTLAFLDKNGNSFACVEAAKETTNSNSVYFNIFSPAQKWATIGLGLRSQSDGSVGTFCPASNWNNSIVTTVSHNSNYVKLGNGLIIQWGATSSENISTVTLPTAFSNTSYGVTATPLVGSANTSDLYIHTKTTTSFKMQEYAQKSEARIWIAIGY